MGEDQADLFAFRRQFDFDHRSLRVHVVVPGEAEAMRRFVDRHDMLAVEGATILLEAFGRRRRMGAQIVVVEDDIHGTADTRLHRTAREPEPAQFSIRQIFPDALDRARQQALEADGLVVDQLAVGFCILHCCLSFSAAAFNASSSASSFGPQKRRMLASQFSSPSKPDGSSE